MSLIWKPEDPDRVAPRIIVNRSEGKPRATNAGLYEELGSKKGQDSPPPAAPTAPRASKQPRYGIVDTTFSTVDMGQAAMKALLGHGIDASRIVRRTVPGFKDLAVAAKQMVERDGCAIVVACGMVGPEPIDKQCGHEASLAIAQAQLMTSTHILEVFVHMDEARTDKELLAVADNRASEHAVNAYWLLERPEELVRRAGTGQRQGFGDLGPADPSRVEGAHLKPSSR